VSLCFRRALKKEQSIKKTTIGCYNVQCFCNIWFYLCPIFGSTYSWSPVQFFAMSILVLVLRAWVYAYICMISKKECSLCPIASTVTMMRGSDLRNWIYKENKREIGGQANVPPVLFFFVFVLPTPLFYVMCKLHPVLITCCLPPMICLISQVYPRLQTPSTCGFIGFNVMDLEGR
jgi:hypothetical protein